MTRSPRRVVITGLGLVCPLGLTADALWSALAQQQSGVGPVSSFPTTHLPTSFAAEARAFTGSIDDFGPLEGEKKKLIRKALKVMCRESQMGVAAAQRALADAGLAGGGFDPDRGGVVFGSDYMITEPQDFTAGVGKCLNDAGRFEFTRWAAQGLPQVTPLWLLKYLPNMPASHVAIFNDLRGPNNSLTIREASSNLAIGEAFRTIARGSADVIVAGATGTRIHPVKFIHSLTQEEVAANGFEPAQASRPFDLNRAGMVLGEGAGAVVLEELTSAETRGAKILGEVIATASSSVLNRQGVASRRQALENAMRAALREAAIEPHQVGHIHAHGLSTRTCDAEEAQAIAAVFGDRAAALPVVAAKSYFGNLGAGSGAVELIASLLAFEHDRLFPVLNHETSDPECPVAVVTDEQTSPGGSVLNLNVTPQGQAAVLVVRRWA
jgi:3-oxoacyl-[acyl-carrier-protein] synthase II